jgi:hypothetical protein
MIRSALSRSDCGIERPRALAVLRLMISSNFVGCSTGRSPGLAPLRIYFLPVGGYASATRVKELANLCGPDRKPLLLLYLGDHDPSGRGMSDQDLPRRLLRYANNIPAEKKWKDTLNEISDDVLARVSATQGLQVRRIALTIEDTRNLGHDLGFSAEDKRDDPRYAWFVRAFGRRCWELDALNPNTLRDRVRRAVMAEMNLTEWQRYVTAETAERESITRTLQTWNSISELARE